MATIGQMVFTKEGAFKILDITATRVVLDGHPGIPLDIFQRLVSAKNISVTDDKRFRLTYRWLDGSGEVTLEMIASNKEDASACAIHPDWFDPETQAFVGLVEA